MLYVGMSILHLDEETFWNLTPRKYAALFRAHIEWTRMVNGDGSSGESNQAKETYIDNIPGW